MEDIEIIDIIARNQSAGFKILVDKYQLMITNTCYGFVRNREDAEDIAQEVFIEIHKSLHKFRNESKLSTWFYRISVNKSLNFIRDNKKNSWFQSLDILFGADKSEGKVIEPNDTDSNKPDRIMEDKETGEFIFEAISSLPKNQKVAFTLHKYEDLSYKEIAEVMELSLSSIESLMFRAKKNLQGKLIKYYKNL
ncbi:MAG: hypothetical protein B6I20_05415 [Bacteroidetes bacterium 4572_117]|nr:MAG: hypothetical protein B6I20_05415 [Bacteroidetes bacterium 4572_117]